MPMDPADVECASSLKTPAPIKKTNSKAPASGARAGRTNVNDYPSDDSFSLSDSVFKEPVPSANDVYEISSDFDHSSACFEDIVKLREQICVEQKIPPPYFLSNTVIREIARVLPQNMDELAQVKGLNEQKISSYGDLILSTTKKYA